MAGGDTRVKAFKFQTETLPDSLAYPLPFSQVSSQRTSSDSDSVMTR